MTKQKKWINHVYNLELHKSALQCHRIELWLLYFHSLWLIFYQFHETTQDSLWGFDTARNMGWYPCIRCHLKCLGMNFTSMFVRKADLRTISVHYVHAIQKLITNHCAEIHKMVNEHLTPEGCLTSSAH